MAAPAADSFLSPPLAELAARARQEAWLTKVLQLVDEELLRQAVRSVRKRAASGVDGPRYADYAEQRDQNLRDRYDRLATGRYRAPAGAMALAAGGTAAESAPSTAHGAGEPAPRTMVRPPGTTTDPAVGVTLKVALP